MVSSSVVADRVPLPWDVLCIQEEGEEIATRLPLVWNGLTFVAPRAEKASAE